jgi:CDP-diacylglycerol--glycerol-3-phosphate 3-phosphatidyltransferase
MPSIYRLKPKFQALLRPAVRQLAAAGITANQVTIAALLLSLATGAAIALEAGGKTLLLLPLEHLCLVFWDCFWDSACDSNQ